VEWVEGEEHKCLSINSLGGGGGWYGGWVGGGWDGGGMRMLGVGGGGGLEAKRVQPCHGLAVMSLSLSSCVCLWKVTEENKGLYVSKVVAWKSGGESEAAIKALVKGMHEVWPGTAWHALQATHVPTLPVCVQG
jgi:hypothetical protein